MMIFLYCVWRWGKKWLNPRENMLWGDTILPLYNFKYANLVGIKNLRVDAASGGTKYLYQIMVEFLASRIKATKRCRKPYLRPNLLSTSYWAVFFREFLTNILHVDPWATDRHGNSLQPFWLVFPSYHYVSDLCTPKLLGLRKKKKRKVLGSEKLLTISNARWSKVFYSFEKQNKSFELQNFLLKTMVLWDLTSLWIDVVHVTNFRAERIRRIFL